MRIKKQDAKEGIIVVIPESFDDLYVLSRVIGKGDRVISKSFRKYKPSKEVEPEQKEVLVEIEAEKVEISQDSQALRITGKIFSGKPEKYVTLGSYHTINVEKNREITILKNEWPGYIMKLLKQAVDESKKPRVGIVVMDEEVACSAYATGRGISNYSEIKSFLSKRMSEKEYERAKEEYFKKVIDQINSMEVDVVIVSGPGFMADELKKFAANKGIKKKAIFSHSSDTGRGGILEVIQSDVFSKVSEESKSREDFEHINRLLSMLRLGLASVGKEPISGREVDEVVVLDTMINQEEIKEVLEDADKRGGKIYIVSSGSDAGEILKNFGGLGIIYKS
ncbi:MAG: mRNA surveillance protein pelota [Candidatus Micrarchaeaceae archaeon]